MNVIAQASDSEGGSFLVAPDPVLVAGVLTLLGVLAFVVFRLVRRRRSPRITAVGSDSVRWLKVTRGWLELVIALLAVGLAAGLLAIAFAPEGVSSGAGPIAIMERQVQVTVEPTFPSESFGTDEGDSRAATERAYERMFGAGAKPLTGQAPDAEILVDEAPIGLWVAAIGTMLLQWGLTLSFLLAFRLLLVRAAAGQPFSVHNVRSLRRMALMLGPGAVLVEIGRYATGTMAVRAGGGTEPVAWHFPTYWLFAALVLLALSEVWRYGASLQRETEATV